MKYLGYKKDNGMISVHTTDKYATYLYVDDMCEEMLGLKPENFLGKSAYAFFNKEDVNTIIGYHDKMAKQGEIVQKKVNKDKGVVYRICDTTTEEKYTWVYSRTLVIGNLFYSYTQYATDKQITDLYFERYEIEMSKSKLSSAKILKNK